MTETRTPRMGLPQYSSQTDTYFDRADANEAFLKVEQNAAIYAQGVRSSRPAAAKDGRFYRVKGDPTASNNGLLFYDDGTAWSSVGSRAEDAVVSSSSAAAVALVVRGFTLQSARLQEWRASNDSVLAYLSKTGGFVSADPTSISAHGADAIAGVRLLVDSGADGGVGLVVRAGTNPAALTEWRNAGGSVLGRWRADGGLEVDSPGGGVSSVGGSPVTGRRMTVYGADGVIGLAVRAGDATPDSDLLLVESNDGSAQYLRVDKDGVPRRGAAEVPAFTSTSTAPTAAANWSVNGTIDTTVMGPWASLSLSVNRTGGGTITGSATGNAPNETMAQTLPAAARPSVVRYATLVRGGAAFGTAAINPSGTVSIVALHVGATIAVGDTVLVSAVYPK